MEVERAQAGVAIEASLWVPVALRTAWEVLTDYGHLAEFIPDMGSSRVVSASGEPLVVEQKGRAGVLFFQTSIHVLLRVEEQPFERIAFHSVGGNLREMHGQWSLRPEAGGTRVGYHASLVPSFWVPPIIGPALIRRSVRSQLQGAAKEMLRREAAYRGQTSTE